ncbi:hypothetical protein LZ554_008856 [Drepanopeziza brunnea f. sp. 'monogermtubi']|nr:hypothetical protein LZ554_008856 [Drepanopeziza brunnea f. sp. 'monogermtubi']
MSKFYFGGRVSPTTTPSSDDDEDVDNLPYPEALPRSDFLAPAFSAPAYLSTLSERHQTLEDLRGDLRERSQALSKELLDLVNTNYEQFLSLGRDLKGGEERVEDVRVGLLGFKRGVEEVRRGVGERREEVDGLLAEKTGVGREMALGRSLLELDERLEELEERLMVESLTRPGNGNGNGNGNGSVADGWSDSEDEDDEEEDVGLRVGASIGKLKRMAGYFKKVETLMDRIGRDHPFIVKQQERVVRLRNTILLDLGTALKQAAGMKEGGKTRLIGILGVYREFGVEGEAVKVLRSLESR